MLFAIKRFKFNDQNPAQVTAIQDLQSEINILSKLNHPNIVRYLGSEQIYSNFCIYLEYMSGGSIASVMNKHGPLLESTVQSYAR
jgi:serine/threonine protein kinase